MLREIRQIALQMAFILFRFLEIISCIGILSSLFVMIWLQVGLGIQILLSCFILFVLFSNLADRVERLRDDKD